MAEATITIYPPITNSWMPAFKQTDKVRIYFAISKFNDISEVKYAQVTCVAQNTNQSILNRINFPLGIKMLTYSDLPAQNTGFSIDITREGDDKYYVELTPNDLQDPEMVDGNKAFYNNQYYKVQIRLATIEATIWDENPKTLYAWNNANLDKLSEWSRVCIIRPIAESQIKLQTTVTKDGQVVMGDLEPINSIPNAFIGIQGKMYFEDGMEQEVLDHYSFTLYQNGLQVYNSKDIFVDSENPNQIYHSLAYNLQDEQIYTLIFDYETSNGYSQTLSFELDIQLNGYDDLNARMYVVPDEENACMAVWLTTRLDEGQIYVDYYQTLKDAYTVYNDQFQLLNTTVGGNVNDYITILRASNEDGFTYWEDLHTENLLDYTDINYVYLDYTAEAGVLYRYAIQKRSTLGGRGKAIYEMKTDPEDPTHKILADPRVFAPEYIYLITKDTQLTVKFDGDVSSYKHVVSENSTETIGSKFPFVMRNGNINYRQFNISGKISTLIDIETGETWNPETQAFIDNTYERKKKAFYGDDYQYYDNYMQDARMDYYTDIVYEKKYRDKVIQYLNDGKIKLFKSTPEGNIMVRLTNVSLNPEKSTGRMIYNFQATATEIAECTIENYEKYSIIAPINYFGGTV